MRPRRDVKVAEHFDAYYYQHGCGQPYQRNPEWLRFFGAVADRIVADIRPRSVLDAGCAMGFLVETLRERAVDAFGVDLSAYAIGQAHPDVRPFCRVGSVAEPFPQRYDLIVSIEVLEHMPQAEAERAVANFCAHADDVLFSSTPLDYREATHVNVQPPERWAELFARHGFYRDVDFDASFLTPWATRYRRRDEPAHRLARDYERRFWMLWKENTDLRGLALEMRAQLAAQDAAGRDAELLRDQAEDLRRRLAQREAQLADLEARAGWLEEQSRAARRALAAVEQGRAMRLLRWLTRKAR
ncbi:MAG: class I SAM-dependent methyltransferase [Kouleothrix sp.]|nr:class I SAM-dependent methyltransferase [Kouleothrix sp.]